MADRPLSNLLVRVSADIANFTKGMSGVDTAANKTRTKLQGMSTLSVAALAAMGAAAIKAGVDLAKLGADVLEVESKFLTVTGASSAMANEWISSFGEMAGFTESEGQKMIGNLANVAVGAGFAQDAATEFAVAAAQLAGDLGSFNNTPTAQVAKDIQSALTGSTETMQKYGIVLKQAEVDALAMANRSDDVTGALNQQERSLAALNIIYRQAGPAVGDVARTQDSAANAAKQLGADFRQLKEDVGVALVPVFQAVVGVMQTTINTINLMAAKFREAGLVVQRFFFRIARNGAAVTLLTEQIKGAREESEAMFIAWATDGTVAMDQAAVDVDDLNARLARQASILDRITTRALPEATTEWVKMGAISVASVKPLGPTADQATRHLKLMGDQADATTDKVSSIADAARNLFSVFTSGGSFLSKIGGVLGAVAPFLSLIPGVGALGTIAAGTAGGILSGLATGGQMGPGGMAVVGEQGPELIQAGRAGATVTPNGASMGGGDIHISLVMDSGRQIVDTITVKQKRDQDVRRIVRVPVSAMAVG